MSSVIKIGQAVTALWGGGRKWPFPITLASGLYNSLYYRSLQAVMSICVSASACDNSKKLLTDLDDISGLKDQIISFEQHI